MVRLQLGTVIQSIFFTQSGVNVYSLFSCKSLIKSKGCSVSLRWRGGWHEKPKSGPRSNHAKAKGWLWCLNSNLSELELQLMSQLKLKVRHSVRSPHVETKPDYTQEQFVLLSSKTCSSELTWHKKTLNQQFTSNFVSRNTRAASWRIHSWTSVTTVGFDVTGPWFIMTRHARGVVDREYWAAFFTCMSGSAC